MDELFFLTLTQCHINSSSRHDHKIDDQIFMHFVMFDPFSLGCSQDTLYLLMLNIISNQPLIASENQIALCDCKEAVWNLCYSLTYQQIKGHM